MVVVDLSLAEPAARRIGRWLLALVAGVLYGLGWVPGRTVVLTVAAARWSASLVALGWHEARQPRAG